MTRFARVTGTLLIAALLWILLGYLASMPLGAIYGWTGHPAVPNAPMAVYILLYLVVLPCACLAAGWKIVGWIGSRVS